MPKHSTVSLAINYFLHVWAIDFNGLFLDFSVQCKCKLLALHKPFKALKVLTTENFTVKICHEENAVLLVNNEKMPAYNPHFNELLQEEMA